MTENRSYAEARSVESTRAELLACAGTQFDPTVVAAFLLALDEGADPSGDEAAAPAGVS